MCKICSDDQKKNTTKLNFNHAGTVHYNDVIMSAMASQMTGVLIVCLNVCSVADQRKHQSSMSVAFVRGIHRWLVNSLHKWPVARKMLSFDDVIMKWKSSYEMRPRILRQPDLRKVDLPCRWKAEMKALWSISILRSRLSINQLSILWIFIILTWMSIIHSCISIIQLRISRLAEIVMDIHDLIMDINNYIMAIHNCCVLYPWLNFGCP